MRGPEIIKAIKREKYMKIAKFVVPVATLAFIVAGVMIFRTDSAESSETSPNDTAGATVTLKTTVDTDNVVFSAKDMQTMSETLADFQSMQFSQKTEIDHAALSISALEDQLAELESELKAMLAQKYTPRQAIPEPSLSVGNIGEFVRDKSIKLVDQANNPGGMNYGRRAQRFGSHESYPDGLGNDVAIFPDRNHGIAALIDLIGAFDGHKIENYIAGGDGIKPYLSFVGGDNKRSKWYLGVFEDQGVPINTVIDIRDTGLIQSIVLVHHHAEGSAEPISDGEWDQAFALFGLSKQ